MQFLRVFVGLDEQVDVEIGTRVGIISNLSEAVVAASIEIVHFDGSDFGLERVVFVAKLATAIGRANGLEDRSTEDVTRLHLLQSLQVLGRSGGESGEVDTAAKETFCKSNLLVQRDWLRA